MSRSKSWALKLKMVKVSRAGPIPGCLVLKALFFNFLVLMRRGHEYKFHLGRTLLIDIRRRLSRWKMKMLSDWRAAHGIREEGLELSKLQELAKVIEPCGGLLSSPDSWSWTLNNSGGYTVASSRNMIDSRLLRKGVLRLGGFDMLPNISEHLRLEVNGRTP
ncbi:hypothetical protein Tco_0705033 [Tanacetum coccineum]|uniref:Uncharacterized protein n=1 Tax=Tanacetum coccineum TaxID=301880 RepID=A0ABQ4Y5C0_9ASTR